MKKFISYIGVFLSVLSYSQETISSAIGFNEAAEGNLYKATDDGEIYIGLRDKTVTILSVFPKVDNLTLTGTGISGSPFKVSQQGATNQQVLTWDDSIPNWAPASSAASSNWFLTGNSNATASTFLGTTNDIKFQMQANNVAILELGRRESLGLWNAASSEPYNEQDASVTYIRGNGGMTALQFEAGGASFYKPIFYTDSDGNFKLRGSSAGTDYFEVGSSGTNGNGKVDFIIGDDGDEPFVFNKFNSSTSSNVELMRLQGIGLNSNVRVGIGTNGAVPNSTLQSIGSISLPISVTTSSVLLDETNYTIILGGNHAITLPAANTCRGRMYIIKNPTTNTPNISNILNLSGVSINTIIAESTIWIESDGADWQQIK